MSRSGYSDDCDNLQLWRNAVDRALTGARGQHFLRKLRTALDAMPEKYLIAHAIADGTGGVCALGAVDPDMTLNPEDRYSVGQHFGIAPAMAAEITYLNDEWCGAETSEQRWKRMRAWVDTQIR